MPTRRQLMAGAAAAGVAIVSGMPAGAQTLGTREVMEAAIREVTKGAEVRQGRVKLELPELAENGNGVPMTVTVDSPMTEADYVREIHVFSERNPITVVARFHLGPRAGKAEVASSVRLAASQELLALAVMSDGTFWSGTAKVDVTLAACLEPG